VRREPERFAMGLSLELRLAADERYVPYWAGRRLRSVARYGWPDFVLQLDALAASTLPMSTVRCSPMVEVM
jgi:hypothetical protein